MQPPPSPSGHARRKKRRREEGYAATSHHKSVSHLVRVLPSTVVLFDQGRALGGRTSVRRGRAEDGRRIVLEDAAPTYNAWDHGCQFFRADTAESCSSILPDWLGAKLAVEWRGRFGRLQGTAPTPDGEAAPDFFGLPTG